MSAELLRAKLAQAEARVSKLAAAVQELDADSNLQAVTRLADDLAIAEAQRDSLKRQVTEAETDEAKAEETARLEDAAGLVAIFDQNDGRISHLPRSLQSRVYEAVQQRNQQRLASKTGLPWSG